MMLMELERMLLDYMPNSLSERMYGEAFIREAETDDRFGETSIAENKEKMDFLDSIGDKKGELFAGCMDLSDIQARVRDGDIPFFSRKAGFVNGFTVTYEAYSTEKLEGYEPHADRLIKEGKISLESVDIVPEGSIAAIASIQINKIGEGYVVSVSTPYDPNEEDPKLAKIRELDKQSYDPQKVFAKVVEFLE